MLAGCDRVFQLDHVPATDAPIVDATADGAAPAALLVQQIANANNATGLDVTLPAKPAPGNTLVVIAGAECGLSNISGGDVATWQLAAYSGVSPTFSIFFGVTDGGSMTVHLTPQCSSKTWGLVTEWSGLAAVNALDVHANMGMSGSGSSGTIHLSVTTTSAPDLLVFGAACYGAIGNATPEWTELHEVVASATITQRAWYQLVPSTAPYAINVSYANEYDSGLATFRTGP